MSPDVTLDNVTFLGSPRPSFEALEEFLMMEMSAGEGVRALGARQIDRAGELANAAWMMDGAHISCRVRRSTLGYSWLADMEGCPDERPYPMRVEFNPNKVSDRVLWLVATLMTVHKTTRADVALDYDGTVPDEWVFRRDRVHPKVHYAPDLCGVESFYLGGVTSDRLIRVYDKMRERIAARALAAADYTKVMRVEGVGRQRYVLDAGLFSGVRVFEPRIPHDLPLDERLLMCAWMHEPRVLAKTGYSRAHEYRLKADAKSLCDRHVCQISPLPDEVYRDARPRLVDEVEGLAHGERSRVAAVYKNERLPDAAENRPAS